MKCDLVRFQRLLGYQFKNISLLKEALTHRSFAMENNLKYDNQRLEFLGDAVLQIVLTVFLFHKYPDSDEGVLTRIRSALANQDTLAVLAHRIDLGDALMLGKGEIGSGGFDRDSTLSDAFEAVLGAVLLDSDPETVHALTLGIVETAYPEPKNLLTDLNPKGTLQEFCQYHFGHQPQYKVVSVDGPDHDPHFTVAVSLEGTVLAEAEASKRKTAEMDAAREALAGIRNHQFPVLDQYERHHNDSKESES